MQYFHESVLKKEAVECLKVKPGGVYIDATGGGGGHSFVVLERLKEHGRLIVLDRDPDACEVLKERLKGYKEAKVVQANFADLKGVLKELGIAKIDGLLMDIGVSSHQLDDESRGFCYSKSARLDMRMEKVGASAEDIVNSYSAEELTRIFRDYGEERFAAKIAKKIVAAREAKKIEKTEELVQIIKSAIPEPARRAGGNPSKRVFQALRIEVNGELDALRQGLQAGFEVLNPGGRLVVISFHSLEDRIVKNMFCGFVGGCVCPPDLPICVCGGEIKADIITRHPITPGQKELQLNKRAKSAKLRALEKR